jgi:hypothetical protein
MEWRSKIGTFCGDFEFKWRRFGGGGRNRRSFFFFLFFLFFVVLEVYGGERRAK